MPHTIRLAAPADAAAIAAIYTPYCEGNAVSFEYVAPTADEIAGRIAAVTSQHPWLVLEDDGAVAGYAYASRHRERAAYQWAVDTAVYVDARFHRRGVGTALYRALFAVLRAQGYFRAHAGITLPNPSSVGLHEAMGFTRVGVYERVGYKLGAWRDVVWYQLALQNGKDAPPSPAPLDAVLGTDVWNDAMAQGARVYRPPS